ncbi:methyltransferase family protein [Achromobacter denitrificans]
MKQLELLIPPPVCTLAAAAAMWLLPAIFPALTLAPPGRLAGAVALGLLGLSISLTGVIAFRRANTTVDPKHPGKAARLVSSGIYRYSRNPMYLGLLIALGGWAVYLGNLLSALCVVVFAAYITRYQIIPEERLLERKFGAAFLAYRNTVRRWL